jgi:hypothetical protein
MLDDDSDEILNKSFVANILELISAADYFAFPKLVETVTDWVISVMDLNVATAWAFLVFVDILGGPTTISHKAMLIIGKK